MRCNYTARASELGCPECPNESLTLTLKREATLFKYWWDCRDCGFESRTCRGTTADEDDLYDEHEVGRIVDETVEQAEANPPF